MSTPNVAFVGGSYITHGMSIRGGIAVKDGRILAVGDDAEIRKVAGPSAEVIDTSGGVVSAGFVDAHLHPLIGGRERSICDLGPSVDAPDALRRIREYADRHPELPWIEGGGWSREHFEGGVPSRHLLDSVVPDRPVQLSERGRHATWNNSAALRLAGIDSSTPDPVDGRIEREADGQPQGTLHEGASAQVRRHAPGPTVENLYEGLLRGQEEAARHGIIGWQDALLHVQGAGVDALDAYRLAVERGTLKSRVTGAIFWDRSRGLEQIQQILERMEKVGPEHDAWFRSKTVKIVVDGVVESFTAAISKPYLDGCGHDTDNQGLDLLTAAELKRAVVELDRLGIQTHFHALGDRAVANALDAIQAARTAHPESNTRHHVAHLQVVQERDVMRFVDVNATANLQPYWARFDKSMDELNFPFLHPDLIPRHFPFADLLAAGVPLAMGSDWPVTSINPLDGIHVAVNRVAEHSPVGAPVFLPEQRIPLNAAWEAYTAGSAFINGRENELGRLAPGHNADLVVLDRDPFGIDPWEIAETQVVSTWVDGHVVYERSGG